MENKIQELTDKIYREGVEKVTQRHSDWSVKPKRRRNK